MAQISYAIYIKKNRNNNSKVWRYIMYSRATNPHIIRFLPADVQASRR